MSSGVTFIDLPLTIVSHGYIRAIILTDNTMLQKKATFGVSRLSPEMLNLGYAYAIYALTSPKSTTTSLEAKIQTAAYAVA